MRSKTVIIVVLALLMVACSETKYVPEGEYLLDKVRVLNDDKEAVGINTNDLRLLVRDRGNSRLFSAAKFH